MRDLPTVPYRFVTIIAKTICFNRIVTSTDGDKQTPTSRASCSSIWVEPPTTVSKLPPSGSRSNADSSLVAAKGCPKCLPQYKVQESPSSWCSFLRKSLPPLSHIATKDKRLEKPSFPDSSSCLKLVGDRTAPSLKSVAQSK